MTPVMILLAVWILPHEIKHIGSTTNVKNWHVAISGLCGLWSGLIISYVTEYYTSHRYDAL